MKRSYSEKVGAGTGSTFSAPISFFSFVVFIQSLIDNFRSSLYIQWLIDCLVANNRGIDRVKSCTP
jgi:hypothetical protein